MKKRPGDARYTFAFAADLQALANEKHIKAVSFSVGERKGLKGSYDYLTVCFLVPRPDRDTNETTEEKPVETSVEPDETTTAAQIDEPVGTVTLETATTELDEELDHKTDAESVEKDEVNKHEIQDYRRSF